MTSELRANAPFSDTLRDRTFRPLPPNEQDTLTTVAIGRLDADGISLPEPDWSDLLHSLYILLNSHGTVVATASGNAYTTDQPEQTTEETAIFLAVNVTDIRYFRIKVGKLLEQYDLTSIGFTTDTVWPIWNPTYNPTEDN